MHIDQYEFGRIVIDGKTYSQDVIIFPESIQDSWWRKSGHDLIEEDLEEVFAVTPPRLVVGTGAYGIMSVSDEVRERCEEADIELVVQKTADAVRTFNESPAGTVAALHLTC